MSCKVSESPYGFTESYSVKFWFTAEDGFRKQCEEVLWTNSKGMHREVHNYVLKQLGKYYKNIEVISIVYV